MLGRPRLFGCGAEEAVDVDVVDVVTVVNEVALGASDKAASAASKVRDETGPMTDSKSHAPTRPPPEAEGGAKRRATVRHSLAVGAVGDSNPAASEDALRSEGGSSISAPPGR